MNLHQFLYAEAGRQRAGKPSAVASGDWSNAEREAWSSALNTYADVATRDLIRDAALVAINDGCRGSATRARFRRPSSSRCSAAP